MSGAVASVALIAAVIEITGWPGLALVSLPLAILLIVVVRAVASVKPATYPRSKANEVLRAVPSFEEPLEEQAIAAPLDASPAADAPASVSAASLPPQEAVDVDKLEALVRESEAASDHAALASRYLALARIRIAEGNATKAREHLKASIGSAVRVRNRAVQAEARLEMAELAREAGDLTTACEHWQIARSLFHDLKEAAALGETEDLMRQHGCPTDWVLNDF